MVKSESILIYKYIYIRTIGQSNTDLTWNIFFLSQLEVCLLAGSAHSFWGSHPGEPGRDPSWAGPGSVPQSRQSYGRAHPWGDLSAKPKPALPLPPVLWVWNMSMYGWVTDEHSDFPHLRLPLSTSIVSQLHHIISPNFIKGEPMFAFHRTRKPPYPSIIHETYCGWNKSCTSP